ncbi:TetR family transcriptional regulator [Salinactinospora qingdaonensis]|uniref:TetR/AcrR family transcriptional regulator n=1 Tax=Salinactinospora qingdaonensis TaxID=702744 RepID=A0ABP7GIT1_9ACTN
MTRVSGDGRPAGQRSGRGVRERLLDAAYTEIVAGRWARMRMADIAGQAGVSRQTLYNEFGTKEGLLQAVVLREGECFLDHVVAILMEYQSEPVRAVGQATRWTLTAAADNLLLRAIITGDTELLPVLTTRAQPIHVALGERMAAFLLERWPELGDLAATVAEVSLRLTISYVLLPNDSERAAEHVETVVGSMLREAGQQASLQR